MCTGEDNVYGIDRKVRLHPTGASGVLNLSTVYSVDRFGTGVCAVST